MKFRRGLALFAALFLTVTMIPTDSLLAATADEAGVVTETVDTLNSAQDTAEEALDAESYAEGETLSDEGTTGDTEEEDAAAVEEEEDGSAAEGIADGFEEAGAEDAAALEESAEEADEADAEDTDLLGDGTLLTLDANGGTFGGGETTRTLEPTMNLVNDTPRREGYLFIGWYSTRECDPDDLLSDLDEDSLGSLQNKPVAGSTIYAGWTDSTCKITYEIGNKDIAYFRIDHDPFEGVRYDATANTMKIKAPKGIILFKAYRPDMSTLHYGNMHYKFMGWSESPDGALIGDDYIPTGNVTLYAKYSSNNRVMTFHAGDDGYILRGSVVTEKIFERQQRIFDDWLQINRYGAFDDNLYYDILHNEDVTKKFAGWYTDADCTQPVEKFTDSSCETPWSEESTGLYYYIQTGTGDVDLYAKWEIDPEIHTLTLDPNTEQGGYFADWQTNKEVKTTKRLVSRDITSYYDYEQGKTVHYLRIANPLNSDPDKKFLGWFTAKTDGECVIPYDESQSVAEETQYDISSIDEDQTLYAQWEDGAYHVITFDPCGGTIYYSEKGTGKIKSTTEPVPFGTNKNGSLSNMPLRFPVINDEGKGFAGWYDEQNNCVFAGSIDGTKPFDRDTTLHAEYKDAWKVTIDFAGGYYDGDFDQTTGKLFDNYGPFVLKVVKGQSVLTAKGEVGHLDYYLKNDDSDKKFDAFYLSTDTEYQNPFNCYEVGYYEPTADTTFIARWVGSCELTFDAGEGKIDGQKTKTYSVKDGTTVAAATDDYLPDPVYPDGTKIFVGWFADAAKTQKIEKYDLLRYKVKRDTTFYAGYQETIKITFDVNDENGLFASRPGTVTFDVLIAKGGSIRGKAPTMRSSADDKIFAGWFTTSDGSEEVDLYATTFSTDTTLYAHWDECYLITFHTVKTGEDAGGAHFENGSDKYVVKVVKGEPYRFEEDHAMSTLNGAPEVVRGTMLALPDWYDADNKRYDFGYIEGRGNHIYGFIPTDNMDFYKKWAAPVTITFNANGGKFSESATLNWEEEGYASTLTDDNTKCRVTVPKGISFGDVYPPYDFSARPVGLENCDWAYTEAVCKNKVSNKEVINEDVEFFAKWSKEPSRPKPDPESELTVRHHAGEGYYHNTDDKERNIIYDLKVWCEMRELPQIDDDTRAFAGWFTDAELTKPFPAANLRLDTDTWYYPQIYFKDKSVKDLYAGYGEAWTVKFDANGGYFDYEGYFGERGGRTQYPDKDMRETSVLVDKALKGQSVEVTDYSTRVRRDGNKVFGGWYLDQACTQKALIYSLNGNDERFKPNAHTTLYAKWMDYSKPDTIEASVKGSDKVTIDIGETVDLVAKLNPACDGKVQWFIGTRSYVANGPYPVKLNIDGRVTGLAKGSCIVYAEVNGVRSNSITIEVSAKKTTATISLRDEDGKPFAGDQYLCIGDTLSVNGVIDPESDRAAQASKVKWTSLNPAVASVAADGDGADAKITAVGEGETTITATLGKKQDTLKVVVTRPVVLSTEDIVLTAKSGAEKTFTITVLDEIDTGAVTITALDDNDSNAVGDDKLVVFEYGAWTDGGAVKTCDVTVRPSDAVISNLTEMEVVRLYVTAPIADGEYSEVATITLNPMQSVKAVRASIADLSEVTRGTGVILTTETSGAKIYYTTGDGEPDTLYTTDAITIDQSMTIKAIARKGDMKDSKPAVFRYFVDDYGDVSSSMYSDPADIPEGIWVRFNGENYTGKGTTTTAFTTPYTGAKITFNDKIEVFSGTTKLVEGRDYTIVYANNTVAADAGAMNATNTKSISPAFTVKGMGNFNASRTFYFGIKPANISGATITSEHTVHVVAGPKAKLTAIKPVVIFNGKKLTLNKDYELKYFEGMHEIDITTYQFLLPLTPDEAAATVLDQAGDQYTIAVVGKDGSNFQGIIIDKVLVKVVDGKNKIQVSTLKVGDTNGKAIKIPSYNEATAEFKAIYYDVSGPSPQLNLAAVFGYNNGEECAPLAYVYAKKPSEPLKYNRDFIVEQLEPDNGNAGKYSFTIIGKDNYIGTKTLTYEIMGTPLARVKVAGLTTTAEYTGYPLELDELYNPKEAVAAARGWEDVTLYTQSGKIYDTLEEDVDYTVTFENNTGRVGKCSLVFTGIGKYSGTIKKPVMVKPYNLGTDSKDLLYVGLGSLDDNDTFVFTKAGVKPSVTVKVGSRKLREGIDYTVSYKNNTKIVEDFNAITKPGQRPTVVITGKGDFVGTSSANYFNITKADAEDAISLSASDVALNAKGKAGYFMAAPKLTDNGAAVAIGKNKDVEPLEKDAIGYYYAEDTELPDGTIKYAGERLLADDPIEPGTVILVLAAVHVSEKSPYKYREGEDVAILEGRYRFIGSDKDISKANVKINTGTTFEYQNGSPVIPLSTSDIEVSFKIKGQKDPVVLDPDDYEIVSVTNNCFLGTATVTLRGKGEYGGIKTVTFKISALSL